MPGMKPTMTEFKAGTLHSGSKTGKIVTNPKQAIAIGLSQQRKAGGNPTGAPTKPTRKTPGTFTAKVKKPKPTGLY
jgi:hypothetical protein